MVVKCISSALLAAIRKIQFVYLFWIMISSSVRHADQLTTFVFEICRWKAACRDNEERYMDSYIILKETYDKFCKDIP